MANKHAKTLTDSELDRMLRYVKTGKHPERDAAIVLLSYKAGLRAKEISGLTKSAIIDASGNLSKEIFVGSHLGKGKKERTIPMHPVVRQALQDFYEKFPDQEFIAYSPYKKHKHMTQNALTVYLHRLYREIGFDKCSSHSGRRTFITKAARTANLKGCSLRDVQMLAGHADLRTTERYIDLSDQAHKLVEAI